MPLSFKKKNKDIVIDDGPKKEDDGAPKGEEDEDTAGVERKIDV